MPQTTPRLSPRGKLRIPGIGRVHVTGGLVDLSMTRAPRNAVQSSTPTRPEPAAAVAAREAAREPREYAELKSRWQAAERGPAKRAALAALRAHESRHGREPFSPMLAVAPRIIDVSTGAESWLEVK